MTKIDRVIKISTIDNGYLLEFHEAKGNSRVDMQEQHHLKSYKTLDELEIDLAKMTSPIAIAAGNIQLN